MTAHLQQIMGDVYLFVTPKELRELADDLESEWKRFDKVANLGRQVPTREIYINDNLMLKICVRQEDME